jgi:hypothetical protein
MPAQSPRNRNGLVIAGARDYSNSATKGNAFQTQGSLLRKVASEEHVRPEHRAVLLKTAEHYRMLAHNINESVAKWDALLRSYGLSSA